MNDIKINRDIELTDGSIVLRPQSPKYIDLLYDAVVESWEETMQWMPWMHEGYTKDETREWLESRISAWNSLDEFDFAIFNSGDVFLGGCGLNHVDLDKGLANLGYWVRKGFTGHGVATAAAVLAAGFGFNSLRLNRLEIVAATGNSASQRVAEKAGAVREGLLRNRIVVRDMIYDAVMFSLIPSDLKLK